MVSTLTVLTQFKCNFVYIIDIKWTYPYYQDLVKMFVYDYVALSFSEPCGLNPSYSFYPVESKRGTHYQYLGTGKYVSWSPNQTDWFSQGILVTKLYCNRWREAARERKNGARQPGLNGRGSIPGWPVWWPVWWGTGATGWALLWHGNRWYIQLW